MSDLLHWVMSWSVLLYAMLALGVTGIVAGWFVKAPLSWLAKGIGSGAVLAAIFLAGYQAATERTKLQDRLIEEQNKTRLTELQRDTALRDLGGERVAAETARRERDIFASLQVDLQKKVAEYEQAEQQPEKPQRPGVAPPPCACDGAFINDRDVRWRRGLRSKK